MRMRGMFRYMLGNKNREKEIIKKMISKISLDDYMKEYLLSRYIDILYDDYDSIAIKNKIAFQIFRLISLISGVLVPIVANFNDNFTIFGITKIDSITILSLSTFISFGFLQLFQNEKVWLHCREIYEIIRTEGYKFLNLAGEYSEYNSHSKAYPFFVEKIEDVVKNDIKVYTHIIDNREKNIKYSG